MPESSIEMLPAARTFTPARGVLDARRLRGRAPVQSGLTFVLSACRCGRITLPEPPDKPQGYALTIARDHIAAAGRDAAGAFYGRLSAQQLIDAGQPVACGTLRDWPALQNRGIHLDLKGYQFRFPSLLQFCRDLARIKINCVLLEIEDKFKYASAPGVGICGAYGKNQFRELAGLCHSLHIELIPKLQCLGHSDYILKHKRYAHLREGSHPMQFCPFNEEGLRLWQAMADELMDALPGGRYFHIGADETSYLGRCPVCRRHSKSECYLKRVGACVDHVRARGRIPIMWDDILRNLHHNLDAGEVRRTWKLGEKAILMYWAYGYGGRNNTFPHLPAYRRAGFTVWGASGCSGCGPSWIQNIPPFQERKLNIDTWVETAASSKMAGLVHTGWTRIASADPPAEPQAACWPVISYAADVSWSGKPAANLWKRMGRNMFGTADPAPLKQLADPDLGDRAQYPEKTGKANDRLELLRALRTLDTHMAERASLIETAQMFHRALRKGALPDYRLSMCRQRLAHFAKQRRTRMGYIKRSLEKYYTRSTVAEFMESRFGIDREIMALLKTRR